MVKIALNLITIIVCAFLLSGCAGTDELTAQVNALETESAETRSVAEEALEASNAAVVASEGAEARAASAEKAALEAASLSAEANAKLDRMFKRSMMK